MELYIKAVGEVVNVMKIWGNFNPPKPFGKLSLILQISEEQKDRKCQWEYWD